MKALIFNSGQGSRLGELTAQSPKCLLRLADGETLLHRQIRLLQACGITEVIITTGPHADLVAEAVQDMTDLTLRFVPNPRYAETNYIWSFCLAAAHLQDDLLLLHGDLVFDAGLVKDMLSDPRPDLCLVHPAANKSPKDFGARVEDGYLREVSVHLPVTESAAFQPLYKLSAATVQHWLKASVQYVEEGGICCYAEDALNRILPEHAIAAYSYAAHYCQEIDTPEDYARVRAEILLYEHGTRFSYAALPDLLAQHGVRKPFLLMGRHLRQSDIASFLETLPHTCYFGIQENPTDESTADALQVFQQSEGDALVSIGGGSTIDTAKAIQYAYLQAEQDVPLHIAIPTTAGSGSEATPFAVLYRGGVKYSLDHPALLPGHAILDSTLLYSLSQNQRLASLLDVICHAVESLLSRHRTPESTRLAEAALQQLLPVCADYVQGDTACCPTVLLAAHTAGRAIAITRTTFAHAMSYSLTTHFGWKHGCAAAICLLEGLRYAEECGMCPEVLDTVRTALHCTDTAAYLEALFASIGFPSEALCGNLARQATFTGRPDASRLSGSALPFTQTDLDAIYAAVFRRLEAGQA